MIMIEIVHLSWCAISILLGVLVIIKLVVYSYRLSSMVYYTE